MYHGHALYSHLRIDPAAKTPRSSEIDAAERFSTSAPRWTSEMSAYGRIWVSTEDTVPDELAPKSVLAEEIKPEQRIP